MTLRRGATILISLVAGLILFVWLTLTSIDPADLFDAASRFCRQRGLILSAGTIERSLPLGVSLGTVTIAGDRPLLSFDRLRITLPLLPLVTGRPQLFIEGTIGDGRVTVTSTIGRKQVTTVESTPLCLERIPFLSSTLGGKVTGELTLRGKGTFAGGGMAGELTLDSRTLETQGVTIGGIPLPDAIYRSLRGAFTLSGNRLQVKSFALEGDGIYLRLTGSATIPRSLPDAPLDMTLEILPRPEFVERQKLLFLLLARHTVSPGVYRLPLSGTLGNPRII